MTAFTPLGKIVFSQKENSKKKIKKPYKIVQTENQI